MRTIRHGSTNEAGGTTAAKRGRFGLEGKLVLFLLLALLPVMALLVGLVVREERKMALEQAKSVSLALAREYAADMKAHLELPLDTARALALAVAGLREAGQATRPAVDAMLAATLVHTPDILALWSCWEPDAFDGKDQEFAETAGHDPSGRFAPLWIRVGGAVERRVLENYDRPDSGNPYLKARERGEEILSEPFERIPGDRKTLVTSLVVPIRSGGKVVGAVGADLPLEVLHKITKEAALYETGFGRLLTFDGVVASHKNDARVGKPAGEFQTADGQAFLARLRAGEEIFERAWSEAEGAWTLKASAPVRVGRTNTPWLFSIVLRDTEVMAAANALLRRLLLTGAGAMLAVALCVWAIARRFVRPLRRVAALAERAKNGDLTIRFEDFAVTSRDEMGEMAAAVAAMITAQVNTLRTLRDEADRLAAETETFAAISAAVKELAAAAEGDTDNVASQMEDLAAAAQEINASVEEVASGAQAAAQRSTEIAGEVDQAHRGGEEGAQAVLSVARSVLLLADESHNSAAQVRNLGARAREIQGFVGQISQIADQTNLLALNAAIEAARAGEAGRGFAVVAEEVRKLAEESNNAARRITDLAAGITKDLDGVVAAVERTSEDSRSASAEAEQTNKTIENILSSLAQITQATQDLAAVSQEQAASSEEIAATVQNIALRVSDATQATKAVRSRMDDVAEEALRVAAGAERLTAVSRALRANLEGFRLAEESAQAAQAPAALPARKR